MFAATLPTSTTVPGCTVPSGNSTSIVAPKANVSSPIGAVVVTCRDGAVSDSTTLSPSRTVPSVTSAVPIERPAGTTLNEPAGTTNAAGSTVTPSDASHAAVAVAVAESKWSSTTIVESALKPSVFNACSKSFTSTPSDTPSERSLASTGVAVASPWMAITGKPLLQKSAVPVATLVPAGDW